jgi:hypothetical protein
VPILAGMAPPIIFSKRVLVAAAMALGIVTGNAAPAQAQNSSDSSMKLLEFGVHYGAPERISGSISGVFSYGRPKPQTGNVQTKALEIRGCIGPGSYGVGIGQRWLLYGPWGPEAMLTVSRTLSSPRRAIGQSTYVGLEVGYQLLGHVSIGFARQVDGPSARRDTTLTWSAGLQIPYGFWRW